MQGSFAGNIPPPCLGSDIRGENFTFVDFIQPLSAQIRDQGLLKIMLSFNRTFFSGAIVEFSPVRCSVVGKQSSIRTRSKVWIAIRIGR